MGGEESLRLVMDRLHVQTSTPAFREFCRIQETRGRFHATRFGENRPSLLEFLDLRRALGAANPRDLVYAHSGMCNLPADNIIDWKADYTKSVSQVYTKFVWATILQDESLAILDRVSNAEPSTRNPNIPSWARTGRCLGLTYTICWDRHSIGIGTRFHDIPPKSAYPWTFEQTFNLLSKFVKSVNWLSQSLKLFPSSIMPYFGGNRTELFEMTGTGRRIKWRTQELAEDLERRCMFLLIQNQGIFFALSITPIAMSCFLFSVSSI